MATPPSAISSTPTSPLSTPRLRLRLSTTFLKPPTLLSPERQISFQLTSSSPSSSNLLVRASDPNREDNFSTISSFQEDASYLVKLGLGSVIGAAVIKYGCIVFPDITRPGLVQALLMISAPAIASVVLMVLASRRE